MMFTTASRKYIINEENGIVGGGSTLFKGHDILFNRQVAIKVISFDSSLSNVALSEQLSRARNEIAALSFIGDMSLRVPCLIDEHYDEKNRKLYIIMQWVNGETLRQKTENRMKNHHEFMQWMINLTEILSFMEKKRFFHNDIKPDNIIIDQAGELHLIDFNLTISNKTINEGTPFYIAPELTTHIEARKDKADMFSIGVMMYEYFSGKLPRQYFEYGMNSGFGIDIKATDNWDVFTEPKSLNNSIPENINQMIIKLMKRVPSQRYTSYAELKRELIAIKRTLPRR